MGSPVSDGAIVRQVNNKLASRGVRAPCHVMVNSKNGDVTLSGNVQFAHQKGAAMHAAAGVSGVRRVIDQMTVQPHSKR